MRTSNKILLGAFVGTLLMCIAILVAIKLALHEPRIDRSTSTRSSSIGLKEITLTDFKGVDLKGYWAARIVREEKENIRVKGPEDLLAALSVNRYGNSLRLHMPRQSSDKRKLHLEMTLPAIQSLRTRGVADVSISGFNLEDLVIDAEGVSSIQGDKGRVRALKFRGKGVSKLNLEKFPTDNVDLACKGVVKIDLNMAGGELSGSIEGVGTVRYKGAVSHEAIQVKGTCKVTRL